MTPHDARQRLETVIHFSHGRPTWDARDREAVLALLNEAEELRALVRKLCATWSQDWDCSEHPGHAAMCAAVDEAIEAARLGCEETKG